MASGSAKPTRAERRAAYKARSQARFKTCQTCDQFDPKPRLAETCRACGCLARLKALLPGETCPEGRW
jgi:hypothetical protein